MAITPSVALSPAALVRRAVSEVVQLPDDQLVIVLEVIEQLKDASEEAGRRALAAQIRAHAHKRAADLRGSSREQIAAEFMTTVDRIRQAAIAQGTAVDDEWRG
jgi:dihydroxyacetone kinase